MSESQATTDHYTIRRWVEERGGKPATVEGTGGGHAGVLRIDFPGYGEEEKLRPLGWTEFFEKFDRENLAFLYQDRVESGDISRFCKFVDRESVRQQVEQF